MKIDTDQLIEAIELDELIGFCLACGQEARGIDPDAKKCRCESCGEMRVYGAEGILHMGAHE